MELNTTVPLVDLGRARPEWAGILSPEYDDELVKTFVQKQFLEDAATYAARYQNTEHWMELLRYAQRRFTLEARAPCILDIGSGAGNSVFPLLDLYPTASVVASDISVPLLAILKNYLDGHYAGRDYVVMQLNAEQLVFQDEQFDLVCGGSILHHLFQPRQAVSECCRVLKPGGSAVFFEPFELGNQILSLAYKHLILINAQAEGVTDPIEPDVLRFLEAICTDYRTRKGRWPNPRILPYLDDKRLFTRRHFEDLASLAGFERVSFDAIGPRSFIFSGQTRTLLRLGLARDQKALPPWAWCYLYEFDRHFSEDAASELLLEACVTFTKSGRARPCATAA